MNTSHPAIYLARHGETAWSLSGQHTGLTDIPLTPRGEDNARRLGQRLRALTFARVFTSPLQRARRTCELAGQGAVALVDPDLVEWNYGDCEGKTTAEIRQARPDWQFFRDGCPGGESVAEVAARADRVIARLRLQGVGTPSREGGDVLVFSSGHILRVLAARWCGLDGSAGRCFALNPGSLSVLAYEHGQTDPVIRLWDDVSHLET